MKNFIAFLVLMFASTAFAGPPIIWGTPYPMILSGGVKMQKSDTTTTCNTAAAGSIRYNAGAFQGCNGTSWGVLGSSAGFYARLTYSGITNCTWQITNAAFVDMAADTDCSAPVLVTGVALTAAGGSAAAPGTRIPQINMTNLPAGEYLVVVSGLLAGDSATVPCFARVSDGTTPDGTTGGASTAGMGYKIMGRFNYASVQSSISFKLQMGGGSGSCYGLNASPLGELSITIYRIS